MQLPLDIQFIEQARRTPAEIALSDCQQAVTYSDVELRSANAADALRARGITAGSLVGLHAERSIDWVVGVLAILRTGAAVVPLPPSYPHVRLRAVLTHADLACVVHAGSVPIPGSLGLECIALQDLCTRAPFHPSTGFTADTGSADRAAFVLCSSGSTGVPKMIVRSHRSFFHRLAWTWSEHPYAAGEVGCHKAHTTTTHGIYELFETLLRGVPTVIVDDSQARDLDQFWRLVRAEGITRLLMVPSAMQASLDLPGFSPPALRSLVLMGEALSPKLARRIVDALPTATTVNSIYGSTEASSTLVCDLRNLTDTVSELPLGRPLTPDINVHILDGSLNPVTPGQAGRLYVSGPALFDGYLANESLTEKVMIRHPLSGSRMYDTRDDVRLADDGKMFFVGRQDDTVKVRGFRVELAEVERAMTACPKLTQAAVMISDGADAALIGFYTPRELTVGEVYRSLKERLPPYMLPAALVGLDSFPLTERSKLDRRRLLAEYRSAERQQPGEFRSMSDNERRVAAVWEETLGHRRFDLDSSFFEAGGTSLTTAVLTHRLRAAFGRSREQLPEVFAYRFPTVAAMARKISEWGDTAAMPLTGTDAILVTMRKAADSDLPPLFCIASAGGTVGAYQKLSACLRYQGEIIGVRDPYVSGLRDPTENFDTWAGRLLDAIRQRDPGGPYCIVAYSSAGCFGLEIVRRLREQGAVVALLVLIDPLGISADRWQRYGWWVLRSTSSHRLLQWLTRAVGRLRDTFGAQLRQLAERNSGISFALAAEDFSQLERDTVIARDRLLALAALMELNTGLPLDLSEERISSEPPDGTMQALLARVARVMPEVDSAAVKRIATQYALQVRMQEAYRLLPFDGATLLVEPVSPYAGLLEAQLRPYLEELRVVRLELGSPDARTKAIVRRFGPWIPHFLCMRDDSFVRALALELDRELDELAVVRA